MTFQVPDGGYVHAIGDVARPHGSSSGWRSAWLPL